MNRFIFSFKLPDHLLHFQDIFSSKHYQQHQLAPPPPRVPPVSVIYMSTQSLTSVSVDSSEYSDDTATTNNTTNTKPIISASVVKVEDAKSSKAEEVVDMSQSLGMRSRHFNKDIKFHQKRNKGHLPHFSQVQIAEMRRVVIKKNMQLLKHHELQPIWVRMGMEGKYPKTQERVIIVAKMKQFAVLSLELVEHMDDYPNNYVST